MELKSDPPTQVFELLISPTFKLDLMLLKKIAVCKINWKQLKRDKISAKKSNFLFLNQIFYMMELKSDPPT